MKATQRNALTRERYARLATGGGPEEKSTEIDPDVSLVAPTLLEMTPVLFSSDLSEAEIMSKNNMTSININFLLDKHMHVYAKCKNIFCNNCRKKAENPR